MIEFIEEQRQVIDELYQIVKSSCPVEFKKAKCRFVYEKFEDGSTSVEQEFYYTQDNKEVSDVLDRDLRRSVARLVKDLNFKMKSHSGGDWDAFTLFINEDGTVSSKFEYSKD